MAHPHNIDLARQLSGQHLVKLFARIALEQALARPPGPGKLGRAGPKELHEPGLGNEPRQILLRKALVLPRIELQIALQRAQHGLGLLAVLFDCAERRVEDFCLIGLALQHQLLHTAAPYAEEHGAPRIVRGPGERTDLAQGAVAINAGLAGVDFLGVFLRHQKDKPVPQHCRFHRGNRPTATQVKTSHSARKDNLRAHRYHRITFSCPHDLLRSHCRK